MEVILVRHGQSIANQEHRYQGWRYDTDLTAEGKRAVEELARHFARTYSVIDEIYTSTALRATESAELIAQGLLMSVSTPDSRLMEIDFGEWSGKTYDEVAQIYPELLNQWATNPEQLSFPNGEAFMTFESRVMEFFASLGKQAKTRVIVVTHEPVIRVVITKLLRRQWSDFWLYTIDNAAFTLIEWDKLPQVISVNEMPKDISE